jgi:membrane protein implicated in regulation of membrane protease activity
MHSDLGKILIIVGIVLVIAGLILSSKLQIPWLGRLPGDIHIKRDNFQFYFPVVTFILLSILLTVIINFFRK